MPFIKFLSTGIIPGRDVPGQVAAAGPKNLLNKSLFQLKK